MSNSFHGLFRHEHKQSTYEYVEYSGLFILRNVFVTISKNLTNTKFHETTGRKKISAVSC